MAERRYYWLKLKEDFFSSKEIKKLRHIAGGDTYTVIYLKMLLRSLKDDGRLYYEGVEADFPAELALDIDESVENVIVTVNYLLSCGILVNHSADEYEIVTAAEMTGSETDSAKRMRKHRAQKMLQSNTQASLCDGSVTERYTEKDKDIELELRDRVENSSCPDFSCEKPDEQRRTYGSGELPYNMAIHLSRKIAKNTTDSKPISESQLQNWANSFQLLFDDGYDWCSLADAVDRFSRDDLLNISVLSGGDFRERLLELVIQWKNTVDTEISEAIGSWEGCE